MATRRVGLTEDDVAALATALPGVEEGTKWNRRTWLVAGAGFCAIRPFSKADVKRFGDAPVPRGTIASLATDDLAEKEAVLAAGHAGVFTIPHFDGYPAVLVELDVVDRSVFGELLEDAWLSKAPPALAASYLRSEERR
ncbi:MAG: hypothetical protein KDA94_12180 [Acidimicrobiales bacterium]|nr:hypothetical protein [Acidimicrobiales bacterium]